MGGNLSTTIVTDALVRLDEIFVESRASVQDYLQKSGEGLTSDVIDPSISVDSLLRELLFKAKSVIDKELVAGGTRIREFRQNRDVAKIEGFCQGMNYSDMASSDWERVISQMDWDWLVQIDDSSGAEVETLAKLQFFNMFSNALFGMPMALGFSHQGKRFRTFCLALERERDAKGKLVTNVEKVTYFLKLVSPLLNQVTLESANVRVTGAIFSVYTNVESNYSKHYLVGNREDNQWYLATFRNSPVVQLESLGNLEKAVEYLMENLYYADVLREFDDD